MSSTSPIANLPYVQIPSSPNSSWDDQQVQQSQSCPSSPVNRRNILPLFPVHSPINVDRLQVIENQLNEQAATIESLQNKIQTLERSNSDLQAIVMAAPPQLTWCEFAKKILLQFAVVVAGLLIAAALAIPFSLIPFIGPVVGVPLGMAVAFIFIMETTTKISNYYIDQAKQRAIEE